MGVRGRLFARVGRCWGTAGGAIVVETIDARPWAKSPKAADWVRQGLLVLADAGIDAVRVEPLATKLERTKGSFYWYFSNRAELHASMLEMWRQQATRGVITRVERRAERPADKLRCLVDVAMSDARGARLEAALRAWASHDVAAAEVVAQVDRERLTYVRDILTKIGVAPETADVRARIIYLMLIGNFVAMSDGGPAADPAHWRELDRLVSEPG